MYDYKWAIQERAEQEAADKYDAEFYDLPEDVQTAVYNRALEAENDNLMARADALLEREREHGS